MNTYRLIELEKEIYLLERQIAAVKQGYRYVHAGQHSEAKVLVEPTKKQYYEYNLRDLLNSVISQWDEEKCKVNNWINKHKKALKNLYRTEIKPLQGVLSSDISFTEFTYYFYYNDKPALEPTLN